MADDAIAFIRALGHEHVDLIGFSLGGGVAQEVALKDPGLVRRLILTGTGVRGGGGLTKMPLIVGSAYLKAAVTRRDPRHFLFFNRNAVGRRAATDYIARLNERTSDRDKPISHQARIAQLLAIREAGLGTPHDLSRITQPTFVANGDNDAMVASSQSHALAERIPNAKLTIYPDSGHGGVFQYHREFVPAVLEFLEA
jgi:pimeloyl-ACP methyl ester carboxylesterase